MSNNSGNCAACGDPASQQVAAENPILSIAAVAQMFKISPLRLRFFEWRGLIRRRRDGDAWVYSWSDCERIALLMKARKAGLVVHEIAAVLRAMDDDTPNAVANDGRMQCLALIHALEGRKKAASEMLAELYRVDWELAERLGVEGSLDGGASVDSV
jgi:DNA-binding transcriptional MerR regulator